MAQTASFREATAVAADSLRSSKLRSFLTLFGIILATTTLIAVMSVIHGMDVYIANSVSDMGADGFHVMRISFFGLDAKKFLELQKKNPQLSPAEYEYLNSSATLVQQLGMGAGRNANITLGTHTMKNIELGGGTANWSLLNNTQIATGRYFTDIENNHHAMVAVVGSDVKNNLFGDDDPIGKTFKIEGRPFTVIGVAVPKGSVFGQSQDGFVQIPIQTYFQIYGSREDIEYAAKAIDPTVLEQAKDEIRMLLRARRHIASKQDDNFAIHVFRVPGRSVGPAHGRDCGHCGSRGLRVHGSGRRGDHEYHAGGGDGAHA